MSTENEIRDQLKIFESYLKENNLKMTRQRQLVVESFLQSEGHLSTDELYENVRRKDQKVGFTTVFRTLKALTDCGLARETHLNDGRTRFEPVYRRPHHHHIVCVECNRTIEFLSPKWEEIQEEIASRYGFRATHHNLQIFGICRECQNEQESTRQQFDSDLVFARDAIKIAMATENRGISFYKTASEIVEDNTTRETFLRMLEDEEGHLKRLQEEWDRLIAQDRDLVQAPVFLHFDYEALKKIFPSRNETMKRLKGNLSEREALRIAMDMEMDARNFFRDYADRFNDTRGRDIFLRFAAEEEEHYNLIKEEYDRLHTD